MMNDLKWSRILLAVFIFSALAVIFLMWQMEKTQQLLIMFSISAAMVLGMQAILNAKKRAFGYADTSADIIWCGGAFIASIFLFLMTAHLAGRFGNKGFLLPAAVALVMLVWYWLVKSEADSVLKQREKERKDEIERCLSMIKSDPGNAAAHERLGELYRAGKELEKSLHHYAEALRLDPSVRNSFMVEDIRREIRAR
ncbi:MAG: tetratricopeptide repeat protein [Elusimicrobia bacterium]|nr:tetratricopeptide repeat protein [Elusimicrobiota bacterium]